MPSRLDKETLRVLLERSRWLIPPLFLVGVLLVGWWAVFHWLPEKTARPQVKHTAEGADSEAPDSATVSLPLGKLAAANLETITVEPQDIEQVHVIPGRIQYDETRHIEIKAPLDGILQEFLVTPGQLVEEGHLVAVLKSPQIGYARSEIIKREQAAQIARRLLEREQLIETCLKNLLASLGENPMISEAAFPADQPLGKYRQEILAALAKLKLARELLNQVKPLSKSGAIPERLIREREAELNVARIVFDTACDQALFNSQQAKLAAEADLAESVRQMDLAWQTVDELLGYRSNRSLPDLSSEDSLSRLEVRAPFTGTIESRGFAKSERVKLGDSLAVLANTNCLYVSASIRENDWSAVSLPPGTVVQIQVPALSNRCFEATVRFVGREMQTESNSLPLIATIENYQGLLRPGMFVRVSVPMKIATRGLSVRPESVVQHDDQTFVFVKSSPGIFKRVDVRTGNSNSDWIEITDGLSPGQLVVAKGAFLLKSELLLQGEGE